MRSSEPCRSPCSVHSRLAVACYYCRSCRSGWTSFAFCSMQNERSIGDPVAPRSTHPFRRTLERLLLFDLMESFRWLPGRSFSPWLVDARRPSLGGGCAAWVAASAFSDPLGETRRFAVVL